MSKCFSFCRSFNFSDIIPKSADLILVFGDIVFKGADLILVFSDCIFQTLQFPEFNNLNSSKTGQYFVCGAHGRSL